MAITKLSITGNTTAVGISTTPVEIMLVKTKATGVPVTPNDNITTTNVQAALEQLDDIKAQATNGTLTNPTISGSASFGDNGKAKFGASDDLQIFHTGSYSAIRDVGTGGLFIGGENYVDIGNAGASETYARFHKDAQVDLYHNNSVKLGTTATGIDVTGDISLADNGKATFGASDDLQIYHDTGNSVIADKGVGDLYIQGSNTIRLTNDDVTEHYAKFNHNGGVELRHDNSIKFNTTSTGIDVTGTVTASEGFVMGNGDQISSTGGMFIDIDSNNDSTAATLDLTRDGKTKKTARFAENGDVSFYEDTGTTPKFFWDASAEKLTIDGSDNASSLATAVTNSVLELNGNSGGSAAAWFGSVSGGGQYVQSSNSAGTTSYDFLINPFGGNVGIGTTSPAANLHVDASAPEFRLSQSGTAKVRLRTSGDNYINTGENLGIGTSSPNYELTVAGGGNNSIQIVSSTTGTGATNGLRFWNTGSSTAMWNYDNTPTLFGTNNNERMRIDSSGNVGIGTTSPDSPLEVQGSVNGVHEVHIQNTFDDNDGTGDNPSSKLRLSAASNNGYIECHGAPEDNASNHRVDFGSTAANSFFTFSPNSAERMRIDSSGNVLVGSTSQFTGGSKASTTVTVDGSVGRKGNRFDDFDDVWSSEDAVIIEGVSNFNPSNSPNAENWYFVKAVTISTGSSNIYCTQTVTTLTGKIFTRYNNDVVGSGSWTSWVEK